MKIAAVAILVPTVASAENIRPEELFLGEAAWLQERAEIQMTAMPSWQRDRWEVGAGVEYGVTPRFQLAIEGAWTDGDQMDTLRELAVGALFAPMRTEWMMLAVGAGAGPQFVGTDVDWVVEPVASVALFSHHVGVNVAAACEIGDEVEPTLALGVFARTNALAPLVEIALRDEKVDMRGGTAIQIGDVQLAAAVGFDSQRTVSVHASLTWELELAGDDGDDTP